jgi:P22 coat protein - gene protein 5
MSVLAANIESDAMSMYKDVYNQANNVGAAATFAKLLDGRRKLSDNLANQSGRTANLNTQDTVDLVDALKGLFHEDKAISKQYREGQLGRTAGFDFMENTLWAKHTSGSDTGAGTSITVNGADQVGASITVTNSGSKTLKKGDIITFAGCNRVHPESKVSTGELQQFAVLADAASTTVTITPSIVITGATQNCSAAPTTTGAVTKVGGASAAYGISMLYAKEAFAIAFADLVMPKGVDWAAREVFDGISMRIVRQYDIMNDKYPARLDVLYGYKTIRPSSACRFANN